LPACAPRFARMPRCAEGTRRADAMHRPPPRSRPVPLVVLKNPERGIRSAEGFRGRGAGRPGSAVRPPPAMPPCRARGCAALPSPAACPVRCIACGPARAAFASPVALLAFLPAAVPLRADRLVAAAQAILEAGGLFGALVAQLEVMPPAFVVEFSRFQRLAHGTARLVAVAAIGEPALLGQRVDVVEQLELFVAGQLQFAHAGRVDQAGATWQR